MYVLLRIALLFNLLRVGFPALAQYTSWRPTFNPMDVRQALFYIQQPHLMNLSNYLGHTVRDKMDDCKAESALFHFRVNSQGKIDSIRVEGNLRAAYETIIVTNIKSTEGKWQLPENTRPGDHCWFIYPHFVFGYTYSCPPESVELYKIQQAHYEVYNRLKLQTETRYGILLSPRELPTMPRK